MSAPVDIALETLWRRSRFASYFYQQVQFFPDAAIPTLALTVLQSRLTLAYRPDFVESLHAEQFIGLLIHEMMHAVLNHDHRALPDESPYLQNVAQDMAVNSYIVAHHTTFFSRTGDYAADTPELLLPPGLPVIPHAFYRATGIGDPSWEDVFRWLKGLSPEERRAHIDSGPIDPGIPLDAGAHDGARLDERIDAAPLFRAPDDERSRFDWSGLRGIVFIDERDETLPTGVHLFHDRAAADAITAKRTRTLSLAEADRDCADERAFQEIRGIINTTTEADIDSWERLLKSTIDFAAQSNEWTYTYGRFNRRYFANGIYAPGRIFREREVITVAVDVSGSMVMNPADIETAFGVIEQLAEKYRVNLLCLDENLFVPEKRDDAFVAARDAGRPYRYQKGDWRFIRTGAGGTTFFAPLFNSYLAGHTEMLLVITDGYIYDIAELREYSPTIWLIAEGRDEPFVAPFGQAVRIRAKRGRR